MRSFFIMFTTVLCGIHLYLFIKLRHLFSGTAWKIGLPLLFAMMLALLLLRRRDFDVSSGQRTLTPGAGLYMKI